MPDLFRSLKRALLTCLPLLGSALAGALLGLGHFGVAAVLMVATSVREARARLVARPAPPTSAAGLLFGATADLYAEFLAFTGLAFFFRASALLFTLTLAALIGSLMVSYGSAKAEARHVPVPMGAMRRPTRVACVAAGASLTPLASVLAQRLGGPPWVAEAPMIVAIAVIALAANVSAVRRLAVIARAPTPALVPRDARAPEVPDASVERARVGQRAA
jgi:hypothetical protein